MKKRGCNTKKLREKGAEFVIKNPSVIKKVYSTALYNDEPKVYSYHCLFKDRYSKKSSDDSIASGVAFDKNRALLKLFGEIVERYALTINNNKKFIFGSYSNLSRKYKNILNPADLIPFSNNQLRLHKINKQKLQSSKLHWVEGKSIMNNKSILIPAQLVFAPYIYQEDEPLIIWPISTGAASGKSLKTAIYKGICEIVERDAYMISYLNKLSLPQINTNKIKNIRIQGMLESLKRYKIEPNLIDITTDIKIPSIAAILVDTTEQGPAISVGLKTGFDTVDTIIGAVEEALMVRSWIRDKFIYLEPKYKRNKIIKTVEDRAHLWFNKNVLKNLDFWLKNKQNKINLKISKNTENNFSKTIKIFKEKNIDVIYVNLTTKEVEGYGFKIVKVIIPQLQPLYLDEQYKYFGKDRLFQAPIDMGFLQKPKSENELNKIPHPFL